MYHVLWVSIVIETWCTKSLGRLILETKCPDKSWISEDSSSINPNVTLKFLKLTASEYRGTQRNQWKICGIFELDRSRESHFLKFTTIIDYKKPLVEYIWWKIKHVIDLNAKVISELKFLILLSVTGYKKAHQCCFIHTNPTLVFTASETGLAV